MKTKTKTLEEMSNTLATKQTWIRKSLEQSMEIFRDETVKISNSGLYVVVAAEGPYCCDIAIQPGSKWLYIVVDPYDLREYSQENEYQEGDIDIIRQVCKNLPTAIETLKQIIAKRSDELEALNDNLTKESDYVHTSRATSQ